LELPQAGIFASSILQSLTKAQQAKQRAGIAGFCRTELTAAQDEFVALGMHCLDELASSGIRHTKQEKQLRAAE
jgi:hypothetical protein